MGAGGSQNFVAPGGEFDGTPFLDLRVVANSANITIGNADPGSPFEDFELEDLRSTRPARICLFLEAVEAIVDRLPRTVSIGNVLPRPPGTKPPEHPVENPAMVAPLAALGAVRRKQFSAQRPFFVTQFVSSHPKSCGAAQGITSTQDPVVRQGLVFHLLKRYNR